MKIEVYNKIKKNSLPLMTDYEGDLVEHDYNNIINSEKCSFLHFTRKMGTYLIKLSTVDYPAENRTIPYLFGTADRNHLLKQIITMVDYHKTNCVMVQYYNHNADTVDIISIDDALSIAQAYTRLVINRWVNERRMSK